MIRFPIVNQRGRSLSSFREPRLVAKPSTLASSTTLNKLTGQSRLLFHCPSCPLITNKLNSAVSDPYSGSTESHKSNRVQSQSQILFTVGAAGGWKLWDSNWLPCFSQELQLFHSMRCSWHYNVIFFVVTLFISPILLGAFLSSMVPRKFCSFINLRNYLHFTIISFVLFFFPQHVSLQANC